MQELENKGYIEITEPYSLPDGKLTCDIKITESGITALENYERNNEINKRAKRAEVISVVAILIALSSFILSLGAEFSLTKQPENSEQNISQTYEDANN